MKFSVSKQDMPVFDDEILNPSPLRSGMKQGCPVSPLSFGHATQLVGSWFPVQGLEPGSENAES